jgi:hypothetical protein
MEYSSEDNLNPWNFRADSDNQTQDLRVAELQRRQNEKLHISFCQSGNRKGVRTHIWNGNNWVV